MGRTFENRKAKMFARWSKNAKAFTKVGKEISIAIKAGGPDINSNPRLRMAVQTAKSLNMPKDRIEAAITRASSKKEGDFQEIVYEAYGPNGVALFIESATDNPTRTVANIRAILSRGDGTLATSGALAHVFERKGSFTIEVTDAIDVDELQLEMMDHGLLDTEEHENEIMLYSTFEDFVTLQSALEERKVEVKSASLQRFALSTVELTDEQEEALEKLIDTLEEDDDVQNVYHNIGSEE